MALGILKTTKIDVCCPGHFNCQFGILSKEEPSIMLVIENRRFTWSIINYDPINYPLGNPLDAFPVV